MYWFEECVVIDVGVFFFGVVLVVFVICEGMQCLFLKFFVFDVQGFEFVVFCGFGGWWWVDWSFFFGGCCGGGCFEWYFVRFYSFDGFVDEVFGIGVFVGFEIEVVGFRFGFDCFVVSYGNRG